MGVLKLNRKLVKLVSGLSIISMLFVSSVIPVSAASISNNAAAVHPYSVSKAEVAADWAKARLKPVRPDKKADKTTLMSSDFSSGSDTPVGTSTETEGTYPTRWGVIMVTSDSFMGLPLGHAAIIWLADTVVESVSSGVTTGPNDWNVSKHECFGVTCRDTTADQDNDASNWCHSQIGKPYNYNYFNIDTRSSFYCAQLVWASFKDLYGIDMNTSEYSSILGNPVHPMELVNTPENYTIYHNVNS